MSEPRFHEKRTVHASLGGHFKWIFLDFRMFRKTGTVGDQYVGNNGELHTIDRADGDQIEHSIEKPDGSKGKGFGTRHH